MQRTRIPRAKNGSTRLICIMHGTNAYTTIHRPPTALPEQILHDHSLPINPNLHKDSPANRHH